MASDDPTSRTTLTITLDADAAPRRKRPIRREYLVLFRAFSPLYPIHYHELNRASDLVLGRSVDEQACTSATGQAERLTVPDPWLSSVHATLSYLADGWRLRDAGSRNGTKVNGKPVTAAVELSDGDLVEVGHCFLIYLGGLGTLSQSLIANGSNFNMQLDFDDCGGSNRCLRRVAMHEFGHILALAHEQNRPDAPSDCTDVVDEQGSDGDLELGAYDDDSIMNYCDINRTDALSSSDTRYIRAIYGGPGAAVKTGDTVALRAFDGRFFSVTDDGDPSSHRPHLRAWEKLTIVDAVSGAHGAVLHYGDTIALRDWKGRFIKAESSGGGVATAPHMQAYEKWKLFDPRNLANKGAVDVGAPVGFRSAHDKFLSAYHGDAKQRPDLLAWEEWRVLGDLR